MKNNVNDNSKIMLSVGSIVVDEQNNKKYRVVAIVNKAIVPADGKH